MTVGKLRRALQGIPDMVPVRLFVVLRGWAVCECGRSWVQTEELYRDLQETVTEQTAAPPGKEERYVLLCTGPERGDETAGR